MRLGVDGVIKNDSIVSYDALTAENQKLKQQLEQAVLITIDQKELLDQIKKEIESGNLVYRNSPAPGQSG